MNQLEIANTALAHLGQTLIVTLADATKSATLCNQFILDCMTSVLRAGTWNCAKKRTELTNPLISSVPFDFYPYRYLLPADYLRIVEVRTQARILHEDHYTIEGGYLRTNSRWIGLVYVSSLVIGANETQPGLIDSLLCETMAYFLAAKVGYALTQDAGVRDDMIKLYTNSLASAKSINARELPAQHAKEDMLLQSRWRAGWDGEGRHDPGFPWGAQPPPIM